MSGAGVGRLVDSSPLPVGAGQLTGITFDGNGRLYLASQTDNTIHVAEADPTFTTFTRFSTISGAGNPGYLEGLQFSSTGEHAVSIQVEDGRGGDDTLEWTIEVSGG